jgi:hypothetical protein
MIGSRLTDVNFGERDASREFAGPRACCRLSPALSPHVRGLANTDMQKLSA